jgi:hypothetical protein
MDAHMEWMHFFLSQPITDTHTTQYNPSQRLVRDNADFRDLTCDMVGRAECDVPAFFPSVNVQTADRSELGFIPFSNFDSDYVRTSFVWLLLLLKYIHTIHQRHTHTTLRLFLTDTTPH